MEITEKLLRYEIQHLEKRLCAVSDELIFLQKFIKQEFGKKFTNFRATQLPIWNLNQSQSQLPDEGLRDKTKKRRRKSNNPEKKETTLSTNYKCYPMNDIDINDSASEEIEDEVEIPITSHQNAGEGEPFSQIQWVYPSNNSENVGSDDDSLTENSIKQENKSPVPDRNTSMDNISNSSKRRGGRVKDPVWNEFSELSGVWACNYCEYTINHAQVERLKKHLTKCPRIFDRTRMTGPIILSTTSKSKEPESQGNSRCVEIESTLGLPLPPPL